MDSTRHITGDSYPVMADAPLANYFFVHDNDYYTRALMYSREHPVCRRAPVEYDMCFDLLLHMSKLDQRMINYNYYTRQAKIDQEYEQKIAQSRQGYSILMMVFFGLPFLLGILLIILGIWG